ncbi:hypothetical protein JCM10213_000306 [Rhodosporidiobolus nylandii]
MKRIVIGVDGTWQSALHQQHPADLSNISRLLTAVDSLDNRQSPPVPQIKLYIPGVGTGEEVAAGAFHGAIGEGVLEKVREAYLFLAQNWDEGDEITLFGFSRGAYVVRLLCTLIHLLGILDRKTNLSLFPTIFDALCTNWNPHNGGEEGARRLEPLLELIKAHKLAQVQKAEGGFLVKMVGLFDTVPLYHFRHLEPTSSTVQPPAHYSPFGLPDSPLEPHIETALHALALDEMRDAYEPLLWRVGPDGLRKGQTLQQTWFAGIHTDVGGGYSLHDLADLSLAWLASHLIPKLSLDLSYLSALSAHPSAPWGEMQPRTRAHLFKGHRRRPLAYSFDGSKTFESLHSSILHQDPANLPSSLASMLQHPTSAAIVPLLEWERRVKEEWPLKDADAADDTASTTSSDSPASRMATSTTSPFLPTARLDLPAVAVVASPAGEPLEKKKMLSKQEVLALLDGLKEVHEKLRAAGDAPGLSKAR